METPTIDTRYACFKLVLAPSKIHRWGVYAGERIPARRKIIEYTGERISRRETKRRADEREFNYLFTLNPYWCLDGSVGGSGAEFINHSCEPNMIAREEPAGHVWYSSLRTIQPGEELLVDYQLDSDEEYDCICGAPSCRGKLNAPKESG